MSEENIYSIELSINAIKEIKLQLEKRKTPNAFIRLGVKSGGCSGYSYVFQFEDLEPKEKDLVFIFSDVRVIVDKKSIIYLNGMVLDWESTFMQRGFKFRNPQQKTSCGCGLSFDVK